MTPNQRHNLYLSEKSAREENIAGRRRFNEAPAISSICPSSYRLLENAKLFFRGINGNNTSFSEMQTGKDAIAGAVLTAHSQ
jgi:hypothetical protein